MKPHCNICFVLYTESFDKWWKIENYKAFEKTGENEFVAFTKIDFKCSSMWCATDWGHPTLLHLIK